jgi:hypothetical protein
MGEGSQRSASEVFARCCSRRAKRPQSSETSAELQERLLSRVTAQLRKVGVPAELRVVAARPYGGLDGTPLCAHSRCGSSAVIKSGALIWSEGQ